MIDPKITVTVDILPTIHQGVESIRLSARPGDRDIFIRAFPDEGGQTRLTVSPENLALIARVFGAMEEKKTDKMLYEAINKLLDKVSDI